MVKLTPAKWTPAKLTPAKLTPAHRRAKKRIYELDLSSCIRCTRRQENWTAKQGREAELLYKHFLWMCYLSRRRPVPILGRNADKVWHNHILDTPRYRKDCNAIFGGYLDHQPIDDMPAQARRAAIAAGRQRPTARMAEIIDLVVANISPELILAASKEVPMVMMSAKIVPDSITPCCSVFGGGSVL